MDTFFPASLSTEPLVGAIIAAGGGSRRMGGTDKIMAPLAGKPLLAHVLDIFERCQQVHHVALVLGAANIDEGRRLVSTGRFAKVGSICLGGARRRDSVAAGLEALAQCEWIVVHDGARPCLTVELIEAGLEAARQTGAAIAAVPARETIKLASATGAITGAVPREQAWLAQTPQVFRRDLLLEAHRRSGDDATDDSALVEALGREVRVYPGSPENIKVTTPEDLSLAEMVLERRYENRHRV